MPFGWIAAAGVVSSLIGANAAGDAADAQTQAAREASGTQLAIYNQNRYDTAPWRQAGENALGQISDRLPQFNHQFDANDLKSNLAPNYQFQLDQGLGAVKNAANTQTGLVSGNALKGINDYAQNFSGNAYQNAFSNYNTNQSNIFNRLSTIAGYGSGANQVTAGAGNTASSNVGASQIAAGQAAASGIVGGANAISGGINNAASWYTLPQIMNGNNGGYAGGAGATGGASFAE